MDRMEAPGNWLLGMPENTGASVPVFGDADRKWLRRQATGLFAAALLLLLVFESSRLDLTLSALAFDPGLGRFPWERHWFFSDLMHHGLKTAAYFFALPALVIALLGWRRRIDWLPPRNARLAIFGMLLIPLLTVALKHLTNRHCPWDMQDFGGYAPYLSLFASTPENIVRGVCFPSGHASGGFAWIIWGLALRATRPVLAKRVLLGALLLGMAMGLARLMQGAHFISHVLWSAWLAWALAIGLAAVLRAPVVAKD